MNDLYAHLCERMSSMEEALAPAAIIVCVSGGRDSMVLLHAMARRALTVPLWALHVHHGIRRGDAEEDRDLVRRFCEQQGIGCQITAVNVPVNQEPGESMEMAARRLRYEAFGAFADSLGTCLIITAHHADDQVETVLEHVLRGSGMHGLSGIPYTRALGKHQIVRPLLACRRFLIDAYQAAYEVPFRDDISNTDVSIRRNRLRHELLPLLRREYNESVDDALLRLTHIVKEEDAVLQAWAAEALPRVAQPIYRGVRWEIPAFQILPVALQRRCINLVLGQLGHLNPIEFSHVEAMRLFLLDEGKRRFRGSNHDMAWRVKDTVFYWTGFRDPGLEQAMSMEISGIGLYPIPGTPWQLSVERANSPTRYPRNHWETWIPWPEDAVVTVRNRKTGDRMHPLGMTGSQLLSDVLAEAKIPQPFRDQYPLLCVGSDIVWVPGVKRSRRHLVTELSAAPHVLRIVSEQDTYIFWEAVL